MSINSSLVEAHKWIASSISMRMSLESPTAHAPENNVCPLLAEGEAVMTELISIVSEIRARSTEQIAGAASGSTPHLVAPQNQMGTGKEEAPQGGGLPASSHDGHNQVPPPHREFTPGLPNLPIKQLLREMGLTEDDLKFHDQIGQPASWPTAMRPTSAKVYFVTPKSGMTSTFLGLHVCTWAALSKRIGVVAGMLPESSRGVITVIPGELALAVYQWERLHLPKPIPLHLWKSALQLMV